MKLGTTMKRVLGGAAFGAALTWSAAAFPCGGAFGPGVPVGAPNRILMGGIAGSMLSLAVVTLVSLRRGRRATHPPVRPGVEWARSAPDPES